VIGNKGAWVLSYANELNYKTPVAHEHVWQEGTQQERRNFFVAMRKSDPSQAVAMLRSTWEHESVVTKRSFLDILYDLSVVEDISFLEDLIDTEFKYQAKEKKTEKECRRIIATILLKHPEAKLYKATVARLSDYFSKAKKGLVGFVTGKDQITFTLPTEDDGFWSAQNMEQVYGFETKNIDIAIYNYPSQFWLSRFIAYLPMSFWTGQFGDYEKLLDHFLGDEKYKTKIRGEVLPIYEEAFMENAKYYRDRELASALVQQLPPTKVITVLALMHFDAYESYVKKNRFMGDIEILLNGPFDHDHPWSVSFSQQVIAHAYEMASQKTTTPMLGKVIAQYINKDAYKELLRYHEKAREAGTYYDLWQNHVFQPVHTALEVRNLIDSFKK
jgi:hypothetical protein